LHELPQCNASTVQVRMGPIDTVPGRS
jgi:hypothetical protein